MKTTPFLFAPIIGIFLFLNACKREEHIPSPLFTGPIKFKVLKVGNGAQYLGLSGEDYPNPSKTQFTYSDDTLRFVIVAKDGDWYQVNESLRYVGSLVPVFTPDKDVVLTYYISVSEDTLRFKTFGSSLFYSRLFGPKTMWKGLPLHDLDNEQLEVKGWKTSLPYCQCRKSGYVENYTQFGVANPRLNVLVENSPMAYDANGETYFYNPEEGLVRSSTYSWWTGKGNGWDLLPDE